MVLRRTAERVRTESWTTLAPAYLAGAQTLMMTSDRELGNS